MEMLIGLVVIALALGAVVVGCWFAIRAVIGRRRRPAPAPAGPAVESSTLRQRLHGLQEQGFTVDDAGGARLTLRLPLLDVRSAAGKVSDEYRLVLTLDEASRTARLSERRVSKESGFGGAGLFRWAASKGASAGTWDRTESGGARTTGGSGATYRLDARQARTLVEHTITEAGWRLA